MGLVLEDVGEETFEAWMQIRSNWGSSVLLVREFATLFRFAKADVLIRAKIQCSLLSRVAVVKTWANGPATSRELPHRPPLRPRDDPSPNARVFVQPF